MKTFYFKPGLLIILFCIAGTAGSFAQDNQFTRKIEREFSIDNKTSLNINNIYGNVNIMNHSDMTVTIQVQVRVDTRDRARADEILDMVSISIARDGDVINAVTSINDNLGRVFRGFNIGGGGLEINYLRNRWGGLWTTRNCYLSGLIINQ